MSCAVDRMELAMDCQDGTESKDSIKFVETFEALQAYLSMDRRRNLIFFPRDHKEIGSYNAESLAQSIERNTSMLTLTLEEVRLSSPRGVERLVGALLRHPNFQRLKLFNNCLGDTGVAALMNAFKPTKLPFWVSVAPKSISFQALCLCGNAIGDYGAYLIASTLTSAPNCVKELDLSSNKITAQGVVHLSGMLSQSNISTFVLNSNQVGSKGAKVIAAAIRSNANLNVLGLCDNDIGDEGAVNISQVAKTHPSLEALLLEDNDIGDRGLMAIADAYRNNSRLGMVEISWNVISMPTMQILAASIDTVVYLYLDQCEIGDTHMEYLAKGLMLNRTVKDLFLEGNQIGLRGTECLARVLSENNCLEGVFLDGNEITREGALMLRDVLKTSNMRLKRLQIPDNYYDIQREMDVYLDMNGAGRRAVLQSQFPMSLWPEFLVQKDGLCDADMVYLFLRERPDLCQRVTPTRSPLVR